MKNTLIVLSLVAGMIFFACGGKDKKAPTNPTESPTARMRVSSNEIYLTGNPSLDLIEISNRGNTLLSYEITELPDWLSISKMNGSAQWRAPDTVNVTVKFDVLAEQEYTGKIKIQSNGGNAEITVIYKNLPPKLTVWLPELQMSRDYMATKITFYNEGGREIDWSVTSHPSWIVLSQDSGTVYALPEEVDVKIDVSTIVYGLYKEKIVIHSNAGDAEVLVNFLYERQIEVFPGVGAGDVAIGDTYLTMTHVHSDPPIYGTPEIPGKMVQLFAKYPSEGLTFKFVPSTTLAAGFDYKKVQSIYMYPPYDGLTEKNIGIGSAFADVLTAYGDPQEIISDKDIVIYSTGIAIYLDKTMTTVTGMSVFAERTSFMP
jgi:hypothetical protein